VNERREEKAGGEDGERQQWAKGDVDDNCNRMAGPSPPAFAITFRHLDRDNVNAQESHSAMKACTSDVFSNGSHDRGLISFIRHVENVHCSITLERNATTNERSASVSFSPSILISPSSSSLS